MIVQGKVWGETKQLFNMNNVEIHEVHILENGFCSKHKHKFKFNQFYVIKGVLKIITWKQYNDHILEDVTIVTDGQSCIVPPGDYHRFVALADTHALEIYYVKLDESDIVREDQGGIDHAQAADIPEIDRRPRKAIIY